MESITSKINEAANTISKRASDAMTSIADTAAAVTDSASAAVTGTASAVTGTAAAAVGDTASAVTGTASAVTDTASAVVTDTASAVTDTASAVTDTASAVVTDTASAVTDTASPFWWLKYVAIIIVLAFVGINVFKIMGDATDTTTSVLSPILSFFGRTSGDLIKQTSDVAARGTKGVITATNTGVNSAVDALKGEVERPRGPPPQPDGRKHKGGFCYIGEEDGFRSCVEVNKADQCMSGEIFPTREVCIHPQLRV